MGKCKGIFYRNKLKFLFYFILSIVCLSILSSCVAGNNRNFNQPLLSEIIDSIQNIIDLSKMHHLDGDKFERLYNIDLGWLDEFSVYISMSNIKAEEIAILKVKDSIDMEKVKEKVLLRLDYQANSFKDYLPQEYNLIENYILKIKGRYLFLVISENADEIKNIINKKF